MIHQPTRSFRQRLFQVASVPIRLFTTGLIFSLLVVSANAQQPDSAELQVRKLVRKLNSADLSERNAAEKQLLDLGVPALPLLPKITDRMPAETRHRLERIRNRLELLSAKTTFESSQLEFPDRKLSLQEAIRLIEKQTGNKIVDYRENFGEQAKPLELQFDGKKRAFWPGLDRMLDQARLTTYNFPEGNTIALINRPQGLKPREATAAYAGPFRFEVASLTARRMPTLEDSSRLTIELMAAWEPRLQPIVMNLKSSEIDATDNDGNALKTAWDNASLEIPISPGSTSTLIELPFSLPPRETKSIARLAGTLHVLLPGKTGTFRFEKFSTLAAARQQQAGVTVTVESVREINQLWEARVRIAFDKSANALESHRGWIYANPCFLELADKTKREPEGFETYRQTLNEVGIAYFFSLEGDTKQATLTYQTPVSLHTLPVKYELKDIALP